MQANNAIEHFEDNSRLVEMVNEYALLLKNGNDDQARNVMNEICLLHHNAKNQHEVDNNLYSQVGKMTRDLHESLNGFMNDTSLHMLTNEDMPNARQRLNHVVELTEKSAHKTISLIEHSNPLLKLLSERSELLQKQLDTRDKSRSTLSGSVSDEISDYLNFVIATSKNVCVDLNEIMLAQNFQDLTGQVINRVSTLVQDVENNLLMLLKLGDTNVDSCAQVKNDYLNKSESLVDINNTQCSKSEDKCAVIKDNKGYGPAVPGVTKGDVLQTQNEVDDLLSSLGF